MAVNDDDIIDGQPSPQQPTDVNYTELQGRCLQTLLRVQDAKDHASHRRSYRAAILARAIAENLNIEPSRTKLIELGVMLRDIGKIGIPDEILNKKGKLTPEEMEIMRSHPAIGVNILTPLLGKEGVILGIVMHHHERWDGTGYPKRLRGNDTALEARVVAVADACIAMVSNRPYRNAVLTDAALKSIKIGAGMQWDPDVVDALLRVPRGIVMEITNEIN